MRKYFTVDEANALLGWLENILARLDPYRDEIVRSTRRQVELQQVRKANGSGRLVDDWERALAIVAELEKSLRDSLEEVTLRGIIVRDVERGLVDFPALRDGREIYLCWVRGEPEVAFWHETDTGFSGRKPL